jgi:esterase
MDTTLLPKDRVVKSGDFNLHYLEWGNPGALPIVLLHGLCSNAHYWDFFACNVAAEYHLFALDQRGHGDSDWAESYGPREYALDLEAFFERLKLSEFVLIGHSMGGINAITHAARHPDQVSALVIVDIGPEIPADGTKRMERERVSEPQAFGTKDEAISYMRKLQPRQPESFIRHQIKYALRRKSKDRLIFKYDKRLLGTELRSPKWLWQYVKEIICPALVIHGTESDMLTAELAQNMAGCMAFGSVTHVVGAGHSLVGDNPEAFEAAVRNFLEPLKPHCD